MRLAEDDFPSKDALSGGCDGRIETHMTGMAARIFLLSPARCDGERSELLLKEKAQFPLARSLRAPEGAELGQVFSFLSGLYFRAKLEYAMAFGARVDDGVASFVITPDRGLVAPTTRVMLADLWAMRAEKVNEANPRYRAPLERDARRLLEALPADAQIVLLGSLATKKYLEPLTAVLGERLMFPADFVGRGDMSRGGLMLRSVEAGEELRYVPVADMPGQDRRSFTGDRG